MPWNGYARTPSGDTPLPEGKMKLLTWELATLATACVLLAILGLYAEFFGDGLPSKYPAANGPR